MFNNQIFGPVTSAPAIIYNDTNMSSDNISCTNLSGSIATFDQLEVVTFNPISFSADYADITNLSCDNLSCQFKSTFGSISTGNLSGTNITLTGDINASEVNASAVNTSNVYADNISTSTITCLANISTPRLYVNDTFFYGSTGSIVASLVTMSSQVLYNLGDLDYKIISVSGTQYLTCDSTLGNINISNLSVDNLSTAIGRIDDLRAQNVNVSGNMYVYGDGGAVGRVRVGGMDFKESSSNNKIAYLDVNLASVKMYLKKSMEFKRDDDAGIVFMKYDYARSNINISNLSCANISTNLLNNISAGQHITLSTEAGTNKLVIAASGELNSSNLSLDNLSIANQLTCGGNISTELIYLSEISIMDVNMSVQNSQFISLVGQDTYNLGSQNYNIQGFGGIKYLICDYTLGNTNISNLSVDNLSTAIGRIEDLRAENINVSNNLYVYGDGGAVGRVRVGGMDFKESSSNNKIAFLDVNLASIKMYLKKSMEFKKDDDSGIVFMKYDYAKGNINVSNLSCANISTNLLNNVSAGENITLSTEAVTNKLVITATGGLNSSNLSLDNLSVDTAITTPSATITDLTTNRISLVPDQSFTPPIFEMTEGTAQITNANMSNLSVDNVSVAGELSTPTIRFKDNTQATKASWFVYPTAMEMYTQNDFRIRNQGFAGSPDFMFMDTSRNNVNISNLSVSHFDVEFVDLTNNLSDGKGINIASSGGKAVISLQDPVNISTITTENMNVSGSAANFFDGANIYGTATVTNLVSDLTNTLSAGSNITITSVGGKAEISSTGGGSVPANLSIDNLSVNFDATIGGDLKMLSADIIATSSELFIQDVTCTRNMSVANAFGANSIAASSSLTVGTNATVTGNITSTFGDIIAVTGQVFAPNVSGTKVTGNNLSVFNDASITRDLQVQRYLDAGKPTFIMLRRSANTNITGGGQPAIFNQNTSAQVNGEFATSGGTTVLVTTGGWYRVSWALGFLRVSNTGGDRIAVRSYSQTYTAGGSWTFNSYKNTISSSCYIRRNNQCREGHISGYNFVYIPAGGAVRIIMECMVEGASSWTSNFSGMQLRGSSNLMVEFVSSAAET